MARTWSQDVGEDRMTEPGPMGAWTFKDLSAHLLGWRDRTIARLEAAAEGRTEPPAPWPAELDDDDSINAWIHEQQPRSLRARRPRRHRPVVRATRERRSRRLLRGDRDRSQRRSPWLGGQALAGTGNCSATSTTSTSHRSATWLAAERLRGRHQGVVGRTARSVFRRGPGHSRLCQPRASRRWFSLTRPTSRQ